MMTPTRKSGRQPKLSTKLKEFLYENDMERMKDSGQRTAEKRKIEIKKEPVSPPPKKKTPVAKKGSENSTYDPKLLSRELKLAAEALQKSPGKKKTATEPETKTPKGGPPAVKKEPVSRPVVKRIVNEKETAVAKKTTPITKTVKKESEVHVVEKRKISNTTNESAAAKKNTPLLKTIKKEPEERVIEKRKISNTSNESPESGGPSRKSRRTPKPSVKLEEFVYEDDREKSLEPTPVRKTPKSAEKARRILIKEEESETSSKRSTSTESRDSSSDSDTLTSPRARVANLTSISAKKGKSVTGTQLTVRKGKFEVMSKSPVTAVRVKHIKTGRVEAKTLSSVGGRKPSASSNAVSVKKVNYLNRPMLNAKRGSETQPKTNKSFNKIPEPTKPVNKSDKEVLPKKRNVKDMKKVEKKEIEKVLQVNKEVMTQLLNFGAEVAEAMACNNESIFSFSTKDNPLQTFKIDKQDDFSDEEVVKIIKWFEEEEEQRRAYRKRILEALRASHETNMSLYTQMLKMLQSVTAS